jgi:hypothetical protein
VGTVGVLSSTVDTAAVLRARSYFRAGNDPWQICPADVMLDSQDGREDTRKAIEEERKR